MFILAACGSTVEPGDSGGQGGSSSGASTGAGSGAPCGGFVGATCGAGEFCDYPDDQCGAADGAGVCVKMPVDCTKELMPTCGCNGTVYDNPCLANAAGVDVATLGCR